MIKLRLQRKGRKKRPYYHIVVADSRSPRDGRIIERLGRFDNVSENQELIYDEERVIYWLKIGAQPSDTVRSILRKEGILYKMHLMRWGKSEEEINAALEEWKQNREAKSKEDDSSRKAKQKEILKAEEKEFKKQLEEKAAAAAKELEKKKQEEAEAKAAAEKEKEEAAAEAKEETAEKAAEPEVPKEEAEAKSEAAEEEKAETQPEPEAEKQEETPSEPEDKEEKAEAEPEQKPEEKKEAKAEKPEEKEEPKEEKSAGSVSTEMNANEAIDHIKNSSIEELKGFVPEDEERVTVQRAWEAKQAE